MIAVFLSLAVPHLWALVPERRADGSAEEFGWLVAPTPFRVEGIGSAVPIFLLLSNVYETTDLIAIQTLPGDDLEFSAAIVDELPVFTRHLMFSGGRFKATVPFTLWNRGIDSDPEDTIQPLQEFDGSDAQIRLLFWESRLEFFYKRFEGKETTIKVFDRDGNLTSDEPTTRDFLGEGYGMVLDLTDDPIDPRVGLRIGRKFRPVESETPDISDILVTDTDLTGYIPLFGKDTLVLNFFTSTSSITRSGVTDEATARANLSQKCVAGTEAFDACIAGENKLVDDYLAYNRYGLATALGGINRLRAYPEGRFKAGNSSFRAIEYRYNFSDKPKDINWFLLGGVNTLLQLAFFFEQGTVSEERLELNKNLRSSYGVGLRALVSSFVYRLDIANGDEGTGVTLIIGYPMELNPVSGE